MALSLGRAGSRFAGVAARALLSASHAANGGAGLQIPNAGVRELLPRLASPMPPSSLVAQAISSQSRAAHTLVMVVVQADPEVCPEYAERLSEAVKNQVAILDKEFRTSGSDSKVSSDEDKADVPVKCPEKQEQLISLVTDRKLCVLTEEEMDTLFDHKMRAAISGLKGDPCVVAIEQLGKNLDVQLYGVKWVQQACFEKLEARSIGQSLILEDLRHASRKKNYVDSFLHQTGKKIFPRKVILATRGLMTMLPYASRYYFYCLCAFSLLKSDVPIRPIDYVLVAVGAQWLASDELKVQFQDAYKYYNNGGKKDAKNAGEKKV